MKKTQETWWPARTHEEANRMAGRHGSWLVAIDCRTEQKECQGKIVGTRNGTAEMHTLQKCFYSVMFNVYYQHHLYCTVTTTKTVDGNLTRRKF